MLSHGLTNARTSSLARHIYRTDNVVWSFNWLKQKPCYVEIFRTCDDNVGLRAINFEAKQRKNKGIIKAKRGF